MIVNLIQSVSEEQFSKDLFVYSLELLDAILYSFSHLRVLQFLNRPIQSLLLLHPLQMGQNSL